MERSTESRESTIDLSPWYDAHYYRSYHGGPYERSQIWLGAMRLLADGIIRECNQPRRVLDAGCAIGLLVEALRDRGVEAYGFDLSPYAIGQAHESVKAWCWVGSLLDPIAERYDLIICHEVLEHLPPGDADAAVARLCAASDDVLFSSTPDGFAEDTHLNVKPVDYWASLFAKQGFVRDLEFDGAGFLAPWGCRFRRSTEPAHRTVGAYERRVWALSRENASLRTRVLEQAALVGRQDQALRERPDTAALEQTVTEQKEHLDALTDRLLCMSDREADLRHMVLEAHDQLVQRDQMLISRVPPAVVQQLHALVDERTAWAQQAVAELESCRALVRELQTTVDARTEWAQGAVKDLEAWRQRAGELQTTLEAHTRWAQTAAGELEQTRTEAERLRRTVDERTAWAQWAATELDETRAVVDDLRRTVDERTAWAQRTASELDETRAVAADLRSRLAAHAHTIDQITSSQVWRAGAPLRKMKRLFNGAR